MDIDGDLVVTLAIDSEKESTLVMLTNATTGKTMVRHDVIDGADVGAPQQPLICALLLVWPRPDVWKCVRKVHAHLLSARRDSARRLVSCCSTCRQPGNRCHSTSRCSCQNFESRTGRCSSDDPSSLGPFNADEIAEHCVGRKWCAMPLCCCTQPHAELRPRPRDIPLVMVRLRLRGCRHQ